ncbi:hypothetical protein P12x_005560 [Tundrisphaera lichenicola]|uniref:hypothetical protein n=1 Tax=Tundrisphaera lichenicola TaxID=2029860 RepID=UPI003EBD61FD
MRSIMPVALFCLAVEASPAVLAQDRATDWQPTPARLARLGPEAKVEGWSLRPPKGWEHRVKREATESRYTWGKEGSGALIVVRPAAQPLKRTPDDVMDSSLGALKARTKGLQLAKPERGSLGGRPFVRVRYRMDPQPQLPGMDLGFVYATAEAGTPVVLMGVGNAGSIEDLEAAAQTYRSQGEAAPGIAEVGADEPGKPLVDQKRQIPTGKEWNCQIAPTKAGTLSIKVEGEGPFSILLLADRSYQALMKQNGKGMSKKDLLLDIQVKGPSYAGEVKVPRGAAWFIIENRSGAAADFHLECTPLDR